MIADDTTEQTIIRSGNIVVVIQKNSCQRWGIDTENLLIRNLWGQLWIQGMDSLNNQYLFFFQPQPLTTLLTSTRREVVTWQLHLFASEEGRELFVQ